MGCESSKRPEINDNREKFCEVFGGRARYWNPRFCFDERAVETRDLMMALSKFGEDFKSMSVKLGMSETTLSRVAGGIAGKKIGKDGQSTTDRALIQLRNILNDYQGPDQYRI